jgi:hypothetical protein
MWFAVALVVVSLTALILWAGSRQPTSNAVRPGTRAFVAALTLPLLRAAIEEKKAAHEAETDPKKKDRLGRELVHLEVQVPHLQQAVESGDTSPGHGLIGFEHLPDDPD